MFHVNTLVNVKWTGEVYQERYTLTMKGVSQKDLQHTITRIGKSSGRAIIRCFIFFSGIVNYVVL